MTYVQQSLPHPRVLFLQEAGRLLRQRTRFTGGLASKLVSFPRLALAVVLLASCHSLLAQLVPVSSPVVLPATNVASSSAAQTILFRTTSAEAISSFSVPLSEGKQQEYTVGTVTGCVVDGTTSNPAGTICSVPITFSPAYPGQRRVPLQVVTSAGKVNIGLSGVGVSPLAVFTPGTVSTLAGLVNAPNCNAYSGPALLGPICNPSAGAVDYAGNVYVAAFYSNTISKIDPSGNIKVIAGTGGGGLSGVGGPATSATFERPSDVVVDAAGNVYFAAEYADQVFRIDAVTQILTSVAGNGNLGYSGDGGPATLASLNRPEGLALDTQGNLYIEDQDNNLIRKVDAAGTITTVAGNPATIGQGLPTYGGDGAPAIQAGLALCCAGVYASYDSITVDAAGNLFIGDSGHHVVRKVTLDGIIHTVAGNHSLGAGFAGDGGSATDAQLNWPMGIAVDPGGDLFIADFSNNRIRKVDAVTQNISTVIGNGSQGYTAGGASTQIYLSGPQKIVLDGRGNLYVADTKNNLIRKSDVSTSTLTFATSTAAGSTDIKDGPLGVVLANIGNAPLLLAPVATGTNPAVSPGFSLYTGESAACATVTSSSPTGSVAPGSSCNLQANFTPVLAGNITGSLVLTDNSLNASSPSAAQTVTLAGTATAAPGAPNPVLTPSALVFVSVTVGAASAAQLATLTNTGNAPLTISSFAITGNASTSFIQTSTCGSTLAAAASCTFAVTCNPVATGVLMAVLAVNYLSPQPQQTVTLSCTGATPTAPQAALTPASFSFGSITLATTNATQIFTLANAGNATLPLTSITLTGGNVSSFAITTNNCGFSVAAGTTCSIGVVFAPLTAGPASATLNVVDSVGNQTSALMGSGVPPVAPQATLTPPTANFGSVPVGTSGGPLTFTLVNAGNAALPITSVAINPANFALTANTCLTSLAAGASCTLTVSFTPTTATSYTATLTVLDSVGTQTSTLSGTGSVSKPPDFTMTPQPSAQSSYWGQSVSYTIALASLTDSNPFTAPVTLTAAGLPIGATATFSPAIVVPGATTVFTVGVPALTAANSELKRTATSLAALLFCLVLTRGRRLAPRLLLLLLACVAASTLSACGSGNGFAIPVSSSTITITGSSGTISHATTVTLTVK